MIGSVALEPSLPEAQADAMAKVGETKIELISAGSDPKRALRHAWKTGQAAKLTTTHDVATTHSEGGVGGGSVPALTLDLDARIAGENDLTVRVTAAKVVPSGDAERLLAEEIQPILKQIVGKEGSFKIDARAAGVVLPKLATDTPPEVLQLWASVEDVVREMAPPFPEEAVGAGARWRVTSRLSRGGFALVRTVQYELAKVALSELSLVADIKERAIDADAKDPALGEIAEQVRLRPAASATQGSARLEIVLGEVGPRKLEMTLDSRMLIDVAARAQGASAKAERSSMRTRQHMLVLPLKP